MSVHISGSSNPKRQERIGLDVGKVKKHLTHLSPGEGAEASYKKRLKAKYCSCKKEEAVD